MSIELDLRDKVTLFVGRRNSGKSYCLKHLIQQQKKLFKEVFIFSPSSFSGYWKGVVPDTNIEEDYSEEWVQKLIKNDNTQQRQRSEKP